VLHDKPAVPGPPAAVGKTREGEGLGPPLAAPPSCVGSEPPKLDQLRLIHMERQAKDGKPRLEGQECPSSGQMGQSERFSKRGSSPSGLKVMLPVGDAASGDWRLSYA